MIKRSEEPRRKHIRRAADSASADGDILDQLNTLQTQITIHLADETKRNQVVDIIYELFVTGKNGTPSFQEQVRTLQAQLITIKWIAAAVFLSGLTFLLARLWEALFP